MSFSAGNGNGTDSIEFDVTVNPDNFIEWDECIVVEIGGLNKDNVIIDSNQCKTTIVDQDGKHS